MATLKERLQAESKKPRTFKERVRPIREHFAPFARQAGPEKPKSTLFKDIIKIWTKDVPRDVKSGLKKLIDSFKGSRKPYENRAGKDLSRLFKKQ